MRTLLACGLFLTFFGVFSSAAPPRKDAETVLKACMTKTQTPEEDLLKFFRNGFQASDATEKVKCTMACMMQEQGDLKDGVFVPDSIAESLKTHMKGKDAQVDAAIAKCKSIKEANDCETAFKINMCLIDQHLGDSV